MNNKETARVFNLFLLLGVLSFMEENDNIVTTPRKKANEMKNSNVDLPLIMY